MVEQRKMSKDNPIRIAWEKYKVTDEYKNSFKWAEDSKHRDGSMWTVYVQGYNDASKELVHPLVKPIYAVGKYLYPENDNRIVVEFCPFCQGKHYHDDGTPDGSGGISGSRVADCGNGHYELTEIKNRFKVYNHTPRMAERIKAQIPGEAGTLAAALITGIRGGMPEKLAEAMRNAGILNKKVFICNTLLINS